MKDAMSEALGKRKGAIKLMISVEPDGQVSVQSDSMGGEIEVEPKEDGDLAPAGKVIDSAPDMANKASPSEIPSKELPEAMGGMDEKEESLKDSFIRRMKMKQRG